MVLAIAAAPTAQAAHWATKEVCEITSLDLPPNWATPDEISEIDRRATEIQNPIGRLWSIKAPNGNVSHLFGTVHSNQPALLNLPAELEVQLANARIVAIESDARPTERRVVTYDRFQSLVFRTARRNDAVPPFEPEIVDWIREYFSGYGVSKPWVIRTDAGVAEMLLWNPCSDFNAGIFPIMDDLIALKGLLAGAELRALEPQRFFLTELSKPPRAEALHGVLQVFGAYTQPAERPLPQARGKNVGAALYARGEIGRSMAFDQLYIEGIYGKERAATFLNASDGFLLRDRNRLWLDGIDTELRMGGVVMAVGAFHLPGKDGLIEMLRDRGFRVERIIAEGEVLR